MNFRTFKDNRFNAIVTTADNKTWDSTDYRLVGSTSKKTGKVGDKNDDDVDMIGKYPVFVDNDTRIFTYTKKITAIVIKEADNV